MSALNRDPFHSDPSNWVCGFIYFSKKDPRIIVPKRLRAFGWTLNFAHPLAFPLLLLLVVIAAAPFEVLKRLHIASPTVIFFVKALLIAGLIWGSVRLSLPRRR